MQCDYNRDCQFEFYPFVNFKKFQSSCHLKSVITSYNWLEKAGLGLVPLVSSSTTTENLDRELETAGEEELLEVENYKCQCFIN